MKDPILVLPHAPQRQTPLSLSNPLDYLVLLYWIILFPQALPWYVAAFGRIPANTGIRRAVNYDPIHRRLAIQGLILTGILLLTATAIVAHLGGERAVLSTLLSAFLSILLGGLAGDKQGVWAGVFVSARYTTINSLMIGATFALASPVGNRATTEIGFLTLAVIVVGVFIAAMSGVSSSVLGGLGRGLMDAAFGAAIAFASGLPLIVVTILNASIRLEVILAVAVSVSILSSLASGMGRAYVDHLPDETVGLQAGFVVVVVGMYLFPAIIVPFFTGELLLLETVLGFWLGIWLAIAKYYYFAFNPHEALAALLPSLMQPTRRLAVAIQRQSVLPICGLARQLTEELVEDWPRGIDTAAGLLLYTTQLRPVIRAIRDALASTPSDLLLLRLSVWLNRWSEYGTAFATSRWELLRVLSSGSLNTRVNPRADTPMGAACAGFWHLSRGELKQAVTAFEELRTLPQGEELIAVAAVLESARSCESPADITNWRLPTLMYKEPLRAQVWDALRLLSHIAEDIALLEGSISEQDDNRILFRIEARLRTYPEDIADCQQPERSLLIDITTHWLKIIYGSTGMASWASYHIDQRLAAVSTTPVYGVFDGGSDTPPGHANSPYLAFSPYIVGRIVPPNRLVGRVDVFQHIRRQWGRSGRRKSLVIYGHRRMGKSSIVHNLKSFCPLGDDTRVAVLNLQGINWVLGLADLCYAIAYRLWSVGTIPVDLASSKYSQTRLLAVGSHLGFPGTRSRSSVIPETDPPEPEQYQWLPLNALRAFLTNLALNNPQSRYILILDEYEELHRLQDTDPERFVTTLQNLTQDFPWLAVALVGLHRPEDRSPVVYEAIRSWPLIRVGLMRRRDVADILQPVKDFKYSDSTIDLVYWLTGGQPFLVQLLGDIIYRHLYSRQRTQADSSELRLTAEDIDHPAFHEIYTSGQRYFLTVWDKVGMESQESLKLLRALASSEHGISRTALRRSVDLDTSGFNKALLVLTNEGVIGIADGILRYRVELMRRWVARLAPP